jgi:uncharacterized protein (DUF433 family)
VKEQWQGADNQLTSLVKDITVDPEILGGIPVFAGTRVPVQNLFDYLEAGKSLPEFIEPFPDVAREQAIGVLEASKTSVLREAECVS